jgi:hypothetical protein
LLAHVFWFDGGLTWSANAKDVNVVTVDGVEDAINATASSLEKRLPDF